MEPILKVSDINVYYGAIHAIKGVSFEVNPGEVVTLIGANGAGAGGNPPRCRPSPACSTPAPAPSNFWGRT